MPLDDRGLCGEQYVENLSPYSSSALVYYPADCNWQPAQQLQHHSLPQEAQSRESDRIYYPAFSDAGDANSHGYITYGHQSVSQATFYTHSHCLWPTGNPGDHYTQGQIDQHHQFYSVIDLSQQSVIQPTNDTTSPNSKPKRKRIQSCSQRKAANVRERRRMFHLNEAFDELRKRLPAFNYEKRLSRIETLRLAMTYISFMKEVSVGGDPKCVKLKPHGAELSPLQGSDNILLVSETYYSYKDNEDCNATEDSDCSNDETSNCSGVNEQRDCFS